jgi:hypothetical protein
LWGPAVEASGQLADGRPYADANTFKKLLADPKQIARCLTQKLLTYGTGAAPSFADRRTVEEIVNRSAQHNYGLRTLVHEVVVSPPFLSK